MRTTLGILCAVGSIAASGCGSDDDSDSDSASESEPTASGSYCRTPAIAWAIRSCSSRAPVGYTPFIRIEKA